MQQDQTRTDYMAGPWAHSAVDGVRHGLLEHLEGTSRLASAFAEALGAAELGRLAGLWHDLGKFHPEWQRYLNESEAGRVRRGGPDHKAAGASLAMEHAQPLAFLIAGHHGGLPSPSGSRSKGNYRSLRQLLADQAARASAALALAHDAIPDLAPAETLPLPAHLSSSGGTADEALPRELFLRLLYSALVDADFLDTERHFKPHHGERREEAPPPDLEALADLIERDQEVLMVRVVEDGHGSAVNAARAEIYRACLDAASRPPGFFRLTVPTGGGKTRAGLAFALRHAARHGLRRVVVAVPFISITEQTAREYREVFGDDDEEGRTVLEHHSGGDIPERWDGGDEHAPGGADLWAQLAAENWDAPIVVTTTVQLFESLFARKPSRMRKLHRLAGSVIVLDEAQALPPRLLEPVLDVLRGLVDHYGVSVVLATATQPAFESIPAFRAVEPVEIVPEPGQWFTELERVDYEWQLDPPMSWAEVAAAMGNEPQALAIVNTKADAMALLDALHDTGVGDALHLSTLLCGAHRRGTIEEVKRRLAADEPCRLVSTQVVEAGVDLDFPLVFRAFAPLDSIVQAAGRCNREGRQAQGRVVVFEPTDGGTPPGYYATARETARSALNLLPGRRPDDLELLRRYFELLYNAVPADAAGVQEARRKLDFPRVAECFRMIEDDTTPVVITDHGSAEEQARVREWLDTVRQGTPDGRTLRRRLQPYTVALVRRQWDSLRAAGLLVEVAPGLGEWRGGYDEVRGLVADIAPDGLVV